MYQHWTCLPFDGVATAVTAALSQLSSIYETTKESSKYVKYTMETAKEGVKEMVGRLDSLVCSRQHDKLEETCPVIFFTKPTKEVVEEPKKEYDSTLKPHVDQTVATKDTSVGKVSAATQYAVDSVKDYSATKVSDATNYTYVKLGVFETVYVQSGRSQCGRNRKESCLFKLNVLDRNSIQRLLNPYTLLGSVFEELLSDVINVG